MRRSVGGLVAILAFIVLFAGCGSSSSTSSPSTSAPASTMTSTVAKPAGCVPVAASLLGELGVTSAGAAVASGPLGNGKIAWYLATKTGAVWVTDVDPAAGGSGLVLPLNQEARTSSEMGADVLATAPIFGAAKLTDPTVRLAQRCSL